MVIGLRLYRNILRAQKQFPERNNREFERQRFTRTVREAFELRRFEKNPERVSQYLTEGEIALNSISKIGNLFQQHPNIVKL